MRFLQPRNGTQGARERRRDNHAALLQRPAGNLASAHHASKHTGAGNFCATPPRRQGSLISPYIWAHFRDLSKSRQQRWHTGTSRRGPKRHSGWCLSLRKCALGTLPLGTLPPPHPTPPHLPGAKGTKKPMRRQWAGQAGWSPPEAGSQPPGAGSTCQLLEGAAWTLALPGLQML